MKVVEVVRTVVGRGALALALGVLATPAAVQAQERGAPGGQPQGGLPAVQSRVQALEGQVAVLRTGLDTLSAKVGTQGEALHAQIAALNGQLGSFQQSLNEINEAFDSAADAVEELERQASGLGEQIAELTEQVADLEERAANPSLGDLAGSPCTTPIGSEGSIEITQSRAGVAIVRCRVGVGRFIDNGDGTITDTETELMWEKKVDGTGCLHCVGDTYTWYAAATGDWLDRLNGKLILFLNQIELGGYSDWRFPTLAELLTIVTIGSSPRIDPTFGPTHSGLYWSASSYDLGEPTRAWGVNFGGFSDVEIFNNKTFALRVRAVRGRR